MTQSQTVQSPCINICVMHPNTGLCVGCYRTLDEIAAWGSLSIQDRQQIVADLPARKANLKQSNRDSRKAQGSS